MSVTLSGSDWSIDLGTNPDYEYTVEYYWALESLVHKKYYKSWDRGSDNDYIICKDIKFLVSKYGSEVLSELLLDTDYMRTGSFILDLGDSNSGVYPASPRYGDTGEFVVSIINVNPTGTLHGIFSHFEYSFTLAVLGCPAFTLPELSSDGLISIGPLLNAFRWPTNGFSPDLNSGVVKRQTNNGRIIFNDVGRNSDAFTTEFICEGKADNISLLIDFLTTNRGAQFSFGSHENYYPFGASFSDSTYNVYCINKKFEIKHDRFNNFQIPLHLLKV